MNGRGTERIGTILYGANNIFSVKSGERQIQCYLKGKILKDAEAEYNPLAVGDRVLFQEDGTGQGRILSRLERINKIARFNKKGKRPQTIACNVDQVLIVTSAESPPFRPRFIDRVCVVADAEKIPPLICLNKIDLGVDKTTELRIRIFEELGYTVFRTSATTREGFSELKQYIEGKRTVLLGQSGTGKTSILNVLLPGQERKTGPISEKYNRGSHTTVLAYMEIAPEGWEIIDTPGVREFEPVGISAQNLSWFFKEFLPFRGLCLYPNCTHTLEPNCAVVDAVEKGSIHPDRYESYLRIFFALKERERVLYYE